MVRITNGKETMEVSKGAFKALFEPYGWKLEGEKIGNLSVESSSPDTLSESEEKDDESNNLPPLNGKDDEEEDDEEDDEEEDIETPFSEMTVRELQQYARKHDIDVSQAKSKKDLKDIILESLQEDE